MDKEIVKICNEIFEKKNTVAVAASKKACYTAMTRMAIGEAYNYIL